MTTQTTLLPGTKLGLLGGGQLGRMFSEAAARMGYHVVVLEPHSPSPAGEVSLEQIDAAYDSAEGLDELARRVPAVTTEFENVPAGSLRRLAEAGVTTAPHADAVAATQDRNVEKAFIEKAGVPTAPHAAVRTEADIEALPDDLFPGILKTARLGYDGKGQAQVASKADVAAAWEKFGRKDCVLEKRLALRTEVSVIICRNAAGETAVFPVCENHHRNGILAYTVMPARIDTELAGKAQRYARQIAEALDYRGVLCVELFVLEDGRVLANELAPRPHNSGHATIEACATSQYEQQVRVMAGLPLGDTTQFAPVVMLNILGDLWFDADDKPVTPPWEKLLAMPGVKLHLYGKAEARHARKMGHATVLGSSQGEALHRAYEAARLLGLPFAEELAE
ncbi:5-(carboxyamino)imidazole ribonucleotide synthase [Sutterella sp.]|uniref:5-(carboxyamino)imidazole ribonucleotide synthase n=1 Tax=Sutterella sp. TaxID=1981025 RepID=UPI0026DECB06|nr:5-(carboxyamino)imidazole ribonucleotide synthase [Sutterella sp.]MDO5530601.1 5-(carboxyamino)imidazole ribonucleotide synthase [Sutterella sp.]